MGVHTYIKKSVSKLKAGLVRNVTYSLVLAYAIVFKRFRKRSETPDLEQISEYDQGQNSICRNSRLHAICCCLLDQVVLFC